MRLFRFSIGVAVAGVIALPPSVSAQTQDASALPLPSGAYLIVINETDSVPPGLRGQFRLVFDSAGGYHLVRNEKELVVGKYTVQGNRLTLVDVSGQMACQGDPALYIWKLTDAGLVLEAVNDTCRGRRYINTVRPLIMVKAE